MSSTSARFEILVAGYLAGDLTAGERNELHALLEANAELRERFSEELESHEMLKIVSREHGQRRPSGSEFVAGVRALSAGVPQLTDEAGESSASRKIVRTSKRQPSSKRIRQHSRRGSNSWIPILIAATVALSIGIYFVQHGRSPEIHMDAIAQVIEIIPLRDDDPPTVIRDGKSERARANVSLMTGDRLESHGGTLRIQYSGEETTLDLKKDAVVVLEQRDGAKRIRLNQGEVFASVAKQPLDTPMMFVTPFGEAQVLGTELTLAIEQQTTRLEVVKGKVRLTNPDKKSVDVDAGHFAVAASGAELSARPIAAPVTPPDANPPEPSREMALTFDFESGVPPVNLQDGEVVQGPKRAGNRFCARGIAKRQGGASKKEIWLEKKGATLFVYNPDLQLSFDYWVTGSDAISLSCFDSTQENSKEMVLSNVTQNKWTHVSIRLSELKNSGKTFTSNDIVMNLLIAVFGNQASELYIDNIEVSRPR